MVDVQDRTAENLEGGRPGELKYGSDLAVDILRRLGIELVALNPGASYRALHDSIVNFRAGTTANGDPEIIECTHEEIAVAAAHGFAKASGRMMAVAVHDVVGLQHASMAIFNAWSDRVPMLVLGGGGPVKAELRRPTDWTHTALVQGNLVRDYVKWDDQPASHWSMVESLIRGYHLASSEPGGPVYICLDGGLLEEELSEADRTAEWNLSGALAAKPPAARRDALGIVAKAVQQATWPVLLVGSGGETPEAFATLSSVANRWGLAVIDAGARLNMATTDAMNLSAAARDVLTKADVIVAVEVKDLVGAVSDNDRTNRTTRSFLRPDSRVFSIGLGDFTARGFSTDYQSLYPSELSILADPASALGQLDELLGPAAADVDGRRAEIAAWHDRLRQAARARAQAQWNEEPVAWSSLVEALRQVLEGERFMIANGDGHRAWVRRLLSLTEPRQAIGGSGGGGLGYGLGATIGACLAHRGTDRIVVDIQSDGDLMMTPGALWTLARYELPALIVMNNNRSYYNDEEHQLRLAEARDRDTKRAGIGTQIAGPDINYVQVAEGMGVAGLGPVRNCDQLQDALAKALEIIKDGKPVLVDVRTQPR